MTWSTRILIGLVALMLAFAAGIRFHIHWAEGKAAANRAQASEEARKVERTNAVSTIRRMDNFAQAQQRNAAAALPARSDLERVRHSLDRIVSAPAPAASATCGADPRLAGLVELLRESAGLVEEGPRHLEELRAQRDALSKDPDHE
ncbi:hypothetical protein SAMN05216359_105254 [Roseateles sp. YR242]|uniref:hypothetical protein n=1 Tax=Roseateles sp. YR242 TaxID=1855305 RepID=UPI0008B2C6EA|nr:hypothetical protein [Roseateles sp. YR242]SEL11669.1 hypothetical protein SAMN05216359_105254 [Roseateles sp. YR242]